MLCVMEEDYLTPPAAAAELGVSLSTVQRYARKGLLRRYYRPAQPNRPLYRRTEVRALLAVAAASGSATTERNES